MSAVKATERALVHAHRAERARCEKKRIRDAILVGHANDAGMSVIEFSRHICPMSVRRAKAAHNPTVKMKTNASSTFVQINCDFD